MNNPDKIVPELAESWSYDASNTKLTFKLRQGVKWHDGKPFTSADVKCTWDALVGKGDEKMDIVRKNPRKVWYINLKEVTVNGANEVTFVLGRPQPSFLTMLAGGYSPVYSCHVPDREMRSKPIGTGPFKVVDFKRNESIKLVKNPDYWKKGKPYLDAIDWKIVPNRSTRMLGFQSGEFDMTFDSDVTFPLLKDVKSSKPDAVCEARPTNVSSNLLVNRDKQPFDNRGDSQGHGDGARHQGVPRHPEPGQRSRRRRHAAAAARLLGHAEGDAAEPARPFARRRKDPGRGPRHHGEARATRPTSRSRSRSRRATSRSIATRR